MPVSNHPRNPLPPFFEPNSFASFRRGDRKHIVFGCRKLKSVFGPTPLNCQVN